MLIKYMFVLSYLLHVIEVRVAYQPLYASGLQNNSVTYYNIARNDAGMRVSHSTDLMFSK